MTYVRRGNLFVRTEEGKGTSFENVIDAASTPTGEAAYAAIDYAPLARQSVNFCKSSVVTESSRLHIQRLRVESGTSSSGNVKLLGPKPIRFRST